MTNSVFLIEELPIIRNSLLATLAGIATEYKITAFSSFEELPRASVPEMIIISLVRSSGKAGIGYITLLKKKYPQSMVIAYDVSSIPGVIRMYYKAGIAGFFSLEDNDIASCIEIVRSGKVYFHNSLVNAFVFHLQSQNRGISRPSLTLRQYEVARMLADGLSNKDIAGHLNIASGTISAVKSSIYKKLKISTPEELHEALMTL